MLKYSPSAQRMHAHAVCRRERLLEPIVRIIQIMVTTTASPTASASE